MKKKIIIISIVLLSLCLIFGIYYLLSRNDNTKEEALTEIKIEEIQESDTTEEEYIVEDTEIDNSDEIQDNELSEKTTNESTTETITTKDSSKSKTDTSSNNTSTSLNNGKKTTTTTSKSEQTTEVQTTTETTSEPSYIGVPDPNSFMYSFHHGQIDYKTIDECLAATEVIGFKDTVDIINLTCMDVIDGEGTVLGYYLYVNCTSGNCEKYK